MLRIKFKAKFKLVPIKNHLYDSFDIKQSKLLSFPRDNIRVLIRPLSFIETYHYFYVSISFDNTEFRFVIVFQMKEKSS